jgi:hypothetical protein
VQPPWWLAFLFRNSAACTTTNAVGSKVRCDPSARLVAPQVIDVEGRTLKLTGTAEEQYREWRKLLHEMSYD